ncbi:MAG TPA: hypothetical protein VGE64_08910 [Xanthomonadaceae bacterium]
MDPENAENKNSGFSFEELKEMFSDEKYHLVKHVYSEATRFPQFMKECLMCVMKGTVSVDVIGSVPLRVGELTKLHGGYSEMMIGEGGAEIVFIWNLCELKSRNAQS